MNLDEINELISLKEFEGAKVELENLLKAEPKNIEALKLLGLCNVNLGNFPEGKKNFETVVKYKNDDATSWFYLANCYDNLNDFLHAESAYREVINLRENYMDAYKSLSTVYMKNEKPQKALELAKKALELVQDNYVFYYIAGTALLAIKDPKGSIPYLDQAHELNPKHAQICNNLGTAYLSLGNYTKAYEYFIKASELEPRNAITFYNIASILQIQNKHEEACKYFQKAYELEKDEHYLVSWALSEFKSEQYEAAIKHYKMLVSQHPEKHNFQYNLACCYEMTGEYIFAIGILNPLTILNPKSISMLQKLANLYLKIDNPSRAKAIYERIIHQGIVSAEIYYEYAMVCVKTGDLDIAETILKKVIDLNPDEAKARKDLGVIYLNKRLFNYAKDEFEKAYELAPGDTGIIFEYANFLQATSDFAKAQEFYEKAFQKDPKNLNILIFNALNTFALNKLDDALKYINLALEISPGNALVLYNAGRIHYALKDFEQAKFFLIKSMEIQLTWDNKNLLALAYFELNEWEKALEIFLGLLKYNEFNLNLLVNIAKCYEKLSDTKLAKRYVRKALKILPQMEEAKELLKKLTK